MKRIFIFFIALCVSFFSVSSGYAQKLDNAGFGSSYEFNDEKKEIKAPRIFSAQLTEEEPAVELDKLYYRLTIALMGYARMDATHQERLMELMEPYRFELTRYAGEFEPDMEAAMVELNKNYKKMQEEIERVDKDYVLILNNFSEENREKVNALWKKQKKLFIDYSNKYFELQHEYLKAYKKLVDFILARPGTYFYDSGTKHMSFNNIGAYRYFGKSVDNLRYIARQKRDLLEDGISGAYEEPVDIP